MTTSETLQRLESLGKEQTRKTFARHGVTSPMFGVNYGDLEKLRKSIKKDQPLANGLWKSGNHDARILAAMIADPALITAKDLTNWAAKAENPLQSMAIAQLAAKSPAARELMKEWTASSDELTLVAGWTLAAVIAKDDESAPDSFFTVLLKAIESGIHKAPNDARASMNGALIAIGRRNAELQKPALAAAKRIGKVEVDHGDTACETPDAATYILKKAPSRK
jgi:3-methyladenine DNA glycosylase AlkD